MAGYTVSRRRWHMRCPACSRPRAARSLLLAASATSAALITAQVVPGRPGWRSAAHAAEMVSGAQQQRRDGGSEGVEGPATSGEAAERRLSMAEAAGGAGPQPAETQPRTSSRNRHVHAGPTGPKEPQSSARRSQQAAPAAGEDRAASPAAQLRPSRDRHVNWAELNRTQSARQRRSPTAHLQPAAYPAAELVDRPEAERADQYAPVDDLAFRPIAPSACAARLSPSPSQTVAGAGQPAQHAPLRHRRGAPRAG